MSGLFVRVTPLFHKEQPSSRIREQPLKEPIPFKGNVTYKSRNVIMELPIGRKELAMLWWKQCPKQCGSFFESNNLPHPFLHSTPSFCKRYCKLVRKNISYLSKKILAAVHAENGDSHQLEIHQECKHKDLVHLEFLNDSSCYELSIGDPKDKKWPWMRFHIEILPSLSAAAAKPSSTLSESSSPASHSPSEDGQPWKTSTTIMHTPSCSRKRLRPKWKTKDDDDDDDESYLCPKRELFPGEIQTQYDPSVNDGTRSPQANQQLGQSSISDASGSGFANPSDDHYHDEGLSAYRNSQQSLSDEIKQISASVFVTPGTRRKSSSIRSSNACETIAAMLAPQKLNFEVSETTPAERRLRKRQDWLLQKGILSLEDEDTTSGITIAQHRCCSSQYLSLPDPEVDNSEDSTTSDTKIYEATQVFDTPNFYQNSTTTVT